MASIAQPVPRSGSGSASSAGSVVNLASSRRSREAPRTHNGGAKEGSRFDRARRRCQVGLGPLGSGSRGREGAALGAILRLIHDHAANPTRTAA
jgi:hypothetical protein